MSSIAEMTRQSVEVLTSPSKNSFQDLQNRGDAADATLYMLLGLGVTVLLGAKGGWSGALNNFIISLVYYTVMCHGVYFVAKRFAGQQESLWGKISYTFALFLVPLSIVIALGGLVFSFTDFWYTAIVPWMMVGVVLTLFYVQRCLNSIMQLRSMGQYVAVLLGAFVIMMGILYMGFTLLDLI